MAGVEMWGGLENTLGTHWELEATCWEQRINEKKSPPSSPQLKRKKNQGIECMLNLSVGCMKFLFPKLFVTIFGLG